MLRCYAAVVAADAPHATLICYAATVAAAPWLFHSVAADAAPLFIDCYAMPVSLRLPFFDAYAALMPLLRLLRCCLRVCAPPYAKRFSLLCRCLR